MRKKKKYKRVSSYERHEEKNVIILNIKRK